MSKQQPPVDQDNVKNIPSKDELIAFFKEQIEVKEYQAKLQELNTSIAVNKAKEIEAYGFIAQAKGAGKTNQPVQGMPHTITQEDLDNNPELVEDGIKVGDQVLIPTTEEFIAEAQKQEESKKRNLKKD